MKISLATLLILFAVFQLVTMPGKKEREQRALQFEFLRSRIETDVMMIEMEMRLMDIERGILPHERWKEISCIYPKQFPNYKP